MGQKRKPDNAIEAEKNEESCVMKFSMDAKTMAAWLSKAASAIGPSAIPALAMLHIEIDHNRVLAASGTNLDIWVKVDAEASGAVEGEIGDCFLLPATQAIAFAGKSKSTVTIDVNPDGRTVVMSCGRSSIALNTLPAKEWPNITPPTDPCGFEIQASDFTRILSQTMASVATDISRPALHGVHLVGDGSFIEAVAVNGHQLSLRRLNEKTGLDVGRTIPTQTCALACKFFTSGIIEVDVGHALIKLSCGDVELTSKLIDIEFPDYMRIIPNLGERRLTVDADDLSNAVSRMQILTEKQSRALKFEIGDDGDLVLSLSNPSFGTSTEIIQTTGWTGGVLVFGANIKYVEAAINKFRGGVATFAIHDFATPIQIYAGVTAPLRGQSDIEVIMPLRVAA
jgi:DNA polymerase III subunit beta